MFLNRFTIKRVLMLICYQTLEPPGGALCGSVDGPRPRYRSRSPLLGCQTVCACAWDFLLREKTLEFAPGGTLSERRVSGVLWYWQATQDLPRRRRVA
jgi:hypothetical protein